MNTLYLSSDRGGIKVGDSNFETLIRNGYGDGKTTLIIKTKKEFTGENNLKYWGVLKGSFYVFRGDCDELEWGDMPRAKLTGYFHVYYSGKVVTMVANGEYTLKNMRIGSNLDI
jgi:hypothetical protein